jgi:hypothetical protein
MATTSAITIATAVYAQFIIISEAITGQFVDFRRLYDVAQTSDLMVRVMNYVRLFNDQVDTSDNTVLSYRKSLTDTATTSDAAAKRVATAKLDQISTADAKSFVAGKPLQDSATAEEYLVKVMNFARFFTDYIITDDTLVVKEPGKNILSGNTAVIEDIIQLTVEYIRNYADTSTLSDTVSLQPRKPFAEALTVLDSFQRQVDFKRSFVDTATTSDLIQLFATFARAFQDNAQTSDIITRIANYFRAFLDGVTMTDAAYITFSKPLSDTAATSDTFVRQVSFNRNPVDYATATDDIFLSTTFARAFSSTATASDQFDRTVGYNRSLSDSYTTSDTHFKGIGKGIQTAASTLDTFDRTAAFHRSFLDEPTARDTFYAIVSFDRGYVESVTASDVTTRHIVKNFTDYVYTVDVIPFSGANFVDTSAVNDVGYYRGQNYSDFSYFAEDFVGYSGTF